MNRLYEEIDKAIEMGFGNERYFTARVLREAKAKIVELENEVERLREELRWRKWPEEVPEKTGYYTIHLTHMKYPATGWFSVHSGWDVKYKRFWWIKLEMPKTEAGGAD